MSKENLQIFKNNLSVLSKLINLDKKEILNLQNKEDFKFIFGLSIFGASAVMGISYVISPLSLLITLPASGFILFNHINDYKDERKKIFNDAVLFRSKKGEEENGEINVLKKKIQSKLENEVYLFNFFKNHYKNDLIKLLDILEINNYPLIYYKKLESAVNDLYNMDYSTLEFKKYAEMLDVDLNDAKKFKEKIKQELDIENNLPNLDKKELNENLNVVDIKISEKNKNIPSTDKTDKNEIKKKLKF